MATIGIDLGGTKCLGLVLDDAGAVLDEHRLPTPAGGDAIVDTLAGVAEELVGHTGGGGVTSVGVGVPGLVDPSGVLRFAPNLGGIAGLDVRGSLAARLGLPVVVDNDANCAAWGERVAGSGAGRDELVLVTLGTGIGGGIILGGHLYRGAHGFAGEVGHMIVERDGPPCPCGQRGCWERFASGSGLGRLAREAAAAGTVPAALALAGGDVGAVRGEHVSEAAAKGEAGAVAVMHHFAWFVALGLASLANVFDPQVFVLGGGLVETGAVLLDPVRAAFAGLVEAADHRPAIPIVAAALGEHAGAIGAAHLARGVAS